MPPEADGARKGDETSEGMEIRAADVMALRERTGAGMMDCKKALGEAAGDLEKAEDWLRLKGMKAADKKAGRATGEGRVQAAIAADGRSGGMIAVCCETDFAAGTEHFQELLDRLCAHVSEQKPDTVEDMLEQHLVGTDETVGATIRAAVGKLGENLSLADAVCLENPEGLVGAYIHHNRKIGVLVSVKTSAAREDAQAHLKALGMHVAFTNPAALKRDDIPAEALERETAIYRQEVRGKPAEIQDRIVQGKLSKFFAQQALVEQAWVKDDALTVAQAVRSLLGEEAEITAFARFAISGA